MNDKNLLYIYNETKHKLMKEENLSLMKDAFEEFIEEFKLAYNFETEISKLFYSNNKLLFKI